MHFNLSLASSWGPHGITVNCLAPGWFKTAQNAVMYEDGGWVAPPSATAFRSGGPGAPNDLDAAVVFLASEESRFVSTQRLLVDRGKCHRSVRGAPAQTWALRGKGNT